MMKKIIFALVISLVASFIMSFFSFSKEVKYADYWKMQLEVIVDKANSGDGIAQYFLSTLYKFGSNKVESNEYLASFWYKKAMLSFEQKDELISEEQRILADMYLMAEYGVKSKKEKGISLLKQSAENGNLFSGYKLADIYKEGRYGFEKDQKQAEYWYNRIYPQLIEGANQGDNLSQNILTNIYKNSNVLGDADLYKLWLMRSYKSRERNITQAIEKDFPLDFYSLHVIAVGFLNGIIESNNELENRVSAYLIYYYLSKKKGYDTFNYIFSGLDDDLKEKLTDSDFLALRVAARLCVEEFTIECYSID